MLGVEFKHTNQKLPVTLQEAIYLHFKFITNSSGSQYSSLLKSGRSDKAVVRNGR